MFIKTPRNIKIKYLNIKIKKDVFSITANMNKLLKLMQSKIESTIKIIQLL
jgi:hypothetical protein